MWQALGFSITLWKRLFIRIYEFLTDQTIIQEFPGFAVKRLPRFKFHYKGVTHPLSLDLTPFFSQCKTRTIITYVIITRIYNYVRDKTRTYDPQDFTALHFLGISRL